MSLKRLVPISLIALSLSVFVPINQIANSNSEYGDPFPGLVSMQEIPGTRVAGDRNISCSWGSERVREGGNTSDSGWTLCVKNYPSGPFPKRPDAPTPTPTQVGLGGYAVVHPNGKVCGVIVALSSDPFGNGGKMPIEYMGCPIGSRIVFQTTASSTGNVAGWHGENVTYNGSEFLIKSGTSDSSTVQTKIQGGVATDSNGRVWDTGSGAVLKPATTQTDTKTATTQTDTKTATTTASAPLAVKIAIPDSNAVEVVVASLTTKAKENQLVTNKTSKNQSVVSVNTEFANSLLQLTANKKGAKTITLPIQTNSKGDAKLNVKTNLSGYTVSLKAGSETLDSDKVK